jgi:hypothetical protein
LLVEEIASTNQFAIQIYQYKMQRILLKALVAQSPKIGLRDENIENMENVLESFGGEEQRKFCGALFILKRSRT